MTTIDTQIGSRRRRATTARARIRVWSSRAAGWGSAAHLSV